MPQDWGGSCFVRLARFAATAAILSLHDLHAGTHQLPRRVAVKSAVTARKKEYTLRLSMMSARGMASHRDSDSAPIPIVPNAANKNSPQPNFIHILDRSDFSDSEIAMDSYAIFSRSRPRRRLIGPNLSGSTAPGRLRSCPSCPGNRQQAGTASRPAKHPATRAQGLDGAVEAAVTTTGRVDNALAVI